ncbi:DUF5682 family protein [Methylovulum psychrotolerans]|uniref:4-aminobutyrate aminotransferase n=1 Tax=Methylovulum psychrotolerans TaxID=1704499 RepID=A0A2S5CH66_9GAMM|nr:DUF5682 family protein [Methylovulum psychrotolerans]POZ50134.1 hypothetical protein AADEFJLK_04031 [Methylovulum psychrotolerans]
MLVDNVFYLGIRHHGPGSADSVLRALASFAADKILLEGPAEAAPLLAQINHPQLQPPVAQLFYATDQPAEAVFYPYTRFSPEWQTLCYAQQSQTPLEFFDLPQTHALALKRNGSVQETEAEEGNSPLEAIDSLTLDFDPLDLLAHAAGFEDGEQWWEQMVEQNPQEGEIFTAIAEAMSVVRTAIEAERPLSLREQYREAWMRRCIRQARKDGYQKIAVVCGAWHVPALVQPITAKQDTALLKGLPKTKINATWIPWTYSRISRCSGYGAGVASPGWYDYLWERNQTDSSHYAVSSGWITRAARLLRTQGLDISPASVIDAVRLAEALATLRDRHPPNPSDMTEAMQTLFGLGDPTALRLLDERLWVSERLGQVPDDMPQTPLQQDFQHQLKSLRLQKEAVEKLLELDLRTDSGRNRSVLLYRLQLLGITWGSVSKDSRSKGTFKETWQLQWRPEFELSLIERNLWGTAIASAAAAFALAELSQAGSLALLLEGLQQLLLADLPAAVSSAMGVLQARAATTNQIDELMLALPGLVRIVRYGDVRATDTAALKQLVASLTVRINIGLINQCRQLDEDTARTMADALATVNSALQLLDEAELNTAWQQVLVRLAATDGIQGVLCGKCYRLLENAHVINAEAVAEALSLALSRAEEPAQAAGWLEGLLNGTGLALLHDDSLRQVLDTYICGLTRERFEAITPLLRRTFATFAFGERRSLLDKVLYDAPATGLSLAEPDFDHTQAALVLPLLDCILGVTHNHG